MSDKGERVGERVDEWVVWNGSLGVLDLAATGRIERHADGRGRLARRAL